MSLNELAAEIHGISRAKGFWPKEDDPNPIERNVGESLMLIVTEVAEAMEAWRDDKWEGTSWHYVPGVTDCPHEIKYEGDKVYYRRVGLNFEVDWPEVTPELFVRWGFAPKPEGVASELADVIIRVLDMCGAHDIDIETAVRLKVAYNATREVLHGRAR